MKKSKLWVMAAILTFCGAMSTQAQVMKSADLEKYAKQKYGDKWLDAAKNLAAGLTLDKNESLTYQQVIEAPGKTKAQLYVALNYWATATFKDRQAITLNDKDRVIRPEGFLYRGNRTYGGIARSRSGCVGRRVCIHRAHCISRNAVNRCRLR